MNAKVSDALQIARSVLGDDMGLVWTDPVLFPKVNQAHKELVAKLILNGLSVEIKASTRITVPATDTDLGVNQPSDIIRIIKIRELATGDSITKAVDMTKQEIIPDVEQGTTLRYWAYDMETITFLGATVNRDVVIHYIRQPAEPTEVNSVLDFAMSEIYIGPRVAALAIFNKDQSLYALANQMAEDNLSKLVRAQVKGDQSLPVRRRPFSYANRRRGSRI